MSQMNSIFSRKPRKTPATAIAAVYALGIVIFAASLVAADPAAQNAADPDAEFKHISEALSGARLSGGDESQALMEKGFAYLDSMAISVLNVPASPHLDEANRRLAGLVAHDPPVGESYRLVKLGGTPPVYAMAINFGLGGPAAVRIYASVDGRYSMAARIDHFVQKDFFDSDVDLEPVSDSEPVFVTISGRTDDLSTGQFSAWRFDGHGVTLLWNSDLLQQSSYEADDKGFHVAYCSRVDDDHPSDCVAMSRDTYRYQDREWKRTEHAEFSPPKEAQP